MSYRTIIVHADLSAHAPQRIEVAARLARAEGAHLLGAAMTGISRFAYPAGRDALAKTVLGSYVDVLYDHANKALAQFDAAARALGVTDISQRLLDDDPAGALLQLAPCCDLIVLGQTDPGEPASSATGVPELVLLNCARPVLVIPYSGGAARLNGRALAAWDGNIEATRALTCAIPLLRRAADVAIAQFRPAQPEAPRVAGADLVAWLARHGVSARLLQVDADIHAGDALLRLAADEQSELLVMGAYGHTRFREHLLGGVTATVLRSMTVPVLMAH